MRFKARAWGYRLDPLTQPLHVLLKLGRPMMALRSIGLMGIGRPLGWHDYATALRQSPTGRVVLRVFVRH